MAHQCECDKEFQNENLVKRSGRSRNPAYSVHNQKCSVLNSESSGQSVKRPDLGGGLRFQVVIGWGWVYNWPRALVMISQHCELGLVELLSFPRSTLGKMLGQT